MGRGTWLVFVGFLTVVGLVWGCGDDSSQLCDDACDVFLKCGESDPPACEPGCEEEIEQELDSECMSIAVDMFSCLNDFDDPCEQDEQVEEACGEYFAQSEQADCRLF